MARELIKTPEFRRTLRVLARQFQRTLSASSTPPNGRRRRPRR
jgi:hypothetical protein